MASTEAAMQTNFAQERELMLEDVLLLAFSLLIGVAALAIVIWVLVTGRLLSLDGLLLTFVSLLFTVIFGGNFAWSVHKGEAQQILRAIRNRRSSDNPL